MSYDEGVFDPAETMSVDERATLQTARLRSLVDRLIAADGVPGRRLRDAGVTGGAELTLADLPRLPTTTKADLWAGYPFGLLAVPPEQLVCMHGSSGTGGRPTLVPYTAGDIGVGEGDGPGARRGGCHAAQIVHNAYGYGLFTGGSACTTAPCGWARPCCPIRRDDRPPGDVDRGSAPGHADLHPVVRRAPR